MVAVLKCEMAAAQKKVFSHPGAWEDSEIITGSVREASVNCGPGQPVHNKVLFSYYLTYMCRAQEKTRVGLQYFQVYTTHCFVALGRGDMAIKRKIESGRRSRGHQLQAKLN